jgi:anaerobic ribonucleoside-triphosphate reductase
MQVTVEQLPQEQRQRCEVWTRVMGYHRPVAAFNPGKQSEHRERRHFTETPAQRVSA